MTSLFFHRPGWCSVCWGWISSVWVELCNTHSFISLSGTWSCLTVSCPRSLSPCGEQVAPSAWGERGVSWSQMVALYSRGTKPSPGNPLKERVIPLCHKTRLTSDLSRTRPAKGSGQTGRCVPRWDPVPAVPIPVPLTVVPGTVRAAGSWWFCCSPREGPGDAELSSIWRRELAAPRR